MKCACFWDPEIELQSAQLGIKPTEECNPVFAGKCKKKFFLKKKPFGVTAQQCFEGQENQGIHRSLGQNLALNVVKMEHTIWSPYQVLTTACRFAKLDSDAVFLSSDGSVPVTRVHTHQLTSHLRSVSETLMLFRFCSIVLYRCFLLLGGFFPLAESTSPPIRISILNIQTRLTMKSGTNNSHSWLTTNLNPSILLKSPVRSYLFKATDCPLCLAN